VSGRGKFDFGASDEFGDDDAAAPEDSSQPRKARLGPMAAAVRDAGEAAKALRGDARASQIETLELALGMKRLREAQLDLRTLPLEQIEDTYLTRDRAEIDRTSLEELKASIRQHRLSQPISVDILDENRFGLIQGRRRLYAYRELLDETGEETYARIPALVGSRGERTAAYQRMVDENVIREDVSAFELAVLAIAFASEESIDPEQAVEVLFASANRSRRWVIKEFVTIASQLGGSLKHPRALSHHLGRRLAKKVGDRGGRDAIIRALEAKPERSEAEEVAILEAGCAEAKGPSRGRVQNGAGSRKLRILAAGGRRRFDVSVSEKRLIVAGKGFDRLDDDSLRAAVERLLNELALS
jgi:ParB family chromosome partitioning protein